MEYWQEVLVGLDNAFTFLWMFSFIIFIIVCTDKEEAKEDSFALKMFVVIVIILTILPMLKALIPSEQYFIDQNNTKICIEK